jgi:hypothetical protein
LLFFWCNTANALKFLIIQATRKLCAPVYTNALVFSNLLTDYFKNKKLWMLVKWSCQIFLHLLVHRELVYDPINLYYSYECLTIIKIILYLKFEICKFLISQRSIILLGNSELFGLLWRRIKFASIIIKEILLYKVFLPLYCDWRSFRSLPCLLVNHNSKIEN